jgi:dUTP pyrophosphatase
MTDPTVYVQIKPLHPLLGKTLPFPKKAHEHDAGFDLCAAMDGALEIAPGTTVRVPCGFALAIPEGFEGQVRPRSGLSQQTTLRIPNAPGTIDAGYRGEVSVLLHNIGSQGVIILPGIRIAQLVIARVPRVVLSIVNTLPKSERGSNGYGSTGS